MTRQIFYQDRDRQYRNANKGEKCGSPKLDTVHWHGKLLIRRKPADWVLYTKRKPGPQKLFFFSLIKRCVLYYYIIILTTRRAVVKNLSPFAKLKNCQGIYQTRSNSQKYKTRRNSILANIINVNTSEGLRYREYTKEYRLVFLQNCLCLDKFEERSRR